MPKTLGEKVAKLEARTNGLESMIEKQSNHLEHISKDLNSLENQIIRLQGTVASSTEKIKSVEKLQYALIIPIVITLVVSVVKLMMGA
jgi:uncharacterized coiled-coil protein SlyX